MGLPDKLAVFDEIHHKQPNFLASCLVQGRLGSDETAVEFLLDVLLVCYLAMNESEYEWPLITEAVQERQLRRTVGAVRFAGDLKESDAVDAALMQDLSDHPEQPLLAYVVRQCTHWLQSVAVRNAAKEADKYVMMAAINLVNCIAFSSAELRSASR